MEVFSAVIYINELQSREECGIQIVMISSPTLACLAVLLLSINDSIIYPFSCPKTLESLLTFDFSYINPPASPVKHINKIYLESLQFHLFSTPILVQATIIPHLEQCLLIGLTTSTFISLPFILLILANHQTASH